ncbi:MAG TPA: glycosyltransferase family 4 protein [Anaerolineae bacterium]|nr:glycosyltransferase family 4 protein [Anaerolineae bacterium]
MKTILYIEAGTYGGGSFESMYQHLCVLDRQKYRPLVVYLNQTPFIERVRALDIPVHLLYDRHYSLTSPVWQRQFWRVTHYLFDRYAKSLYLPFIRRVHAPVIGQIVTLIRQERVDLIHLNNHANRDLFAIMAAEATNTPCISHLRSMRGSVGFDHQRATYTDKIVTTYIANSQTTQNYWATKHIDISRTHLIHNGIPLLPIKAAPIRQQFNWDADTPVIACISPLTVDKGQEFLLAGFAHFHQQYPSARLLIIGGGTLQPKLENLANQLGIANKTTFAGYVTNAKEMAAAADIMVVPSKEDSFGRVVLESFLAQTPLVATDVGSIREVVTPEQNGLLVPYNDVNALTNAWNRLLTDKTLRQKLTTNGYQTIKENFSINEYARRVALIYDEILNNNQ